VSSTRPQTKFIPIAGQLDDVIVVGLVLRSFVRSDGGELLREHWPGPPRSLVLVLRARWVGALRVTGPVFQSDEPVWGLTEEGTVRYPWRFPTEPDVALDPVLGVPGAEAAKELAILSRLKQWGTYLQRSLNSVPDEDGERLLEMLKEPRQPVPILVPRRRRARPAEVRATAPEPGHLEAQAIPVQLTAVETPPEEPLTESRTHSEIQAKLRDIGIFEGFDVWVADRGTEYEGEPLGKGCLTDLPLVAAERTREVMKNIDVIWFRRGTGHPVRFFEIEHSTSVYSGWRPTLIRRTYRRATHSLVGGQHPAASWVAGRRRCR
jgi:hypothetical protein